MKLVLSLVLLGFVLPGLTFAAVDPALSNLTKSQVEDVAKEIAVDLNHTSVAAPSTNGFFGVEVGLVGSRTKTPHLADRIDDAGGTGSDFNQIYGGGLIVRGHFPLDLFVELSMLPTYKTSSLEVKSSGFSAGWNMGGFFNWPIDLAFGADFSRSKLNFDQTIASVDSNIGVRNSSRTLWVGVSKTFLIVTPYAKFGAFSTDSDVKQDGTSTTFTYTTSSTSSVSSTGAYGALGVNVQILLFRLGIEGSRTAGVSKGSAKFSFAF